MAVQAAEPGVVGTVVALVVVTVVVVMEEGMGLAAEGMVGWVAEAVG